MYSYTTIIYLGQQQQQQLNNESTKPPVQWFLCDCGLCSTKQLN